MVFAYTTENKSTQAHPLDGAWPSYFKVGGDLSGILKKHIEFQPSKFGKLSHVMHVNTTFSMEEQSTLCDAFRE